MINLHLASLEQRDARTSGRELRYVAAEACELREFDPTDGETGDDAQRDMGGYAAVFNSPATIGGYFQERIAPGAFANAIKTCDVRALFNHDANFVIGRNVSRTLTLSEDDRGLLWRATPPKTTWAADLAVSIKRGDISGCSFSFVPTVEEWDYSQDMPLRTLDAHRPAPRGVSPADRSRIDRKIKLIDRLNRA